MANGHLIDTGKEAEKRPPWPDYGHHMGLNLGLFLQTGRYNASDYFRVKSDGYTGVFLGES